MIKQVLDNLPVMEKRKLMYAHEHGFSQRVDLPENKYVGVNIPPSKRLAVLEGAGVWTYGVKR